MNWRHVARKVALSNAISSRTADYGEVHVVVARGTSKARSPTLKRGAICYRRICGETHTGCGLRMVAASGIVGRAAELWPVS
ncbi:MAG: hypothetical protein U0936_13345 [Planctomycetaceae bacterium]